MEEGKGFPPFQLLAQEDCEDRGTQDTRNLWFCLARPRSNVSSQHTGSLFTHFFQKELSKESKGALGTGENPRKQKGGLGWANMQ